MKMFARRMCQLATNNPPVAAQLCNRNPRNLERMRIAYKPSGFFLDKRGKSFWHNLELTTSNRYVSASSVHYLNGTVVTASTSEWSIRKQLYRTQDTCAFMALATVFADRCLKFGITEMQCLIQPVPNGKVEKFLNILTEHGVSITEPFQYIHPNQTYTSRPEKPWKVHEK